MIVRSSFDQSRDITAHPFIFVPDPGRYRYSPERIKKTMSTIDPTVVLRSGRRQSGIKLQWKIYCVKPSTFLALGCKTKLAPFHISSTFQCNKQWLWRFGGEKKEIKKLVIPTFLSFISVWSTNMCVWGYILYEYTVPLPLS